MERRFENGAAQKALAAFSALMALLGLAMVSQPDSRGSGVFFLVVGGFFVARALRTSAVIVDDSGVKTQSIVRTRNYPFSKLRGVDVAVGRTGLAAFGREHLVLHLIDGEDVAFRELNCPPPKEPSEPSVVRSAAACINERKRRAESLS